MWAVIVLAAMVGVDVAAMRWGVDSRSTGEWRGTSR